MSVNLLNPSRNHPCNAMHVCMYESECTLNVHFIHLYDGALFCFLFLWCHVLCCVLCGSYIYVQDNFPPGRIKRILNLGWERVGKGVTEKKAEKQIAVTDVILS